MNLSCFRDAGGTSSVHRVAKILRRYRIKAQIDYKRRCIKGGSAGKVAANLLNWEFNHDAPNKSRVSDTTYVRTYDGFLYVATVFDLFSRRIVGWLMGKNIDRYLVIDALLMAKLRLQPHHPELLHSNQGSQYGSNDCLAFMTASDFIPSMSRRGNCHDNGVAEGFFATFKIHITRRQIYATREGAKTEIFNFIEMFYNPIKRYSHNGGLSPVKYEDAYFQRLQSVS